MENLKLEHLAPYLPYGLKVSKIHTLNIANGIGSIKHVLTTKSKEYKPILRPMSDLTEKLFWELSEGTPADTFAFFYGKYNADHDKRDYIYRQGYSSNKYFLCDGVEQFPYRMMQFFFKHHFDVFGLIEKGLALDKSATELNP